MADKDLYKILGVNKNATQEELKRAYRKLTMELHPDRNPDNREEAERKFKEMKAAYDILSDEQKRATYDRHGFEAASGHGAGPTHCTARPHVVHRTRGRRPVVFRGGGPLR